MSFLRRTTGSLTSSIRQITSQQHVKDSAFRGASITAGKQIFNHFAVNPQNTPKKSDIGKSIMSHIHIAKKANPQSMFPSSNNSSFNLSGAKCVLSSNAEGLQKMFASFDLSSLSISFAGMLGEFAVWAITDPTTGETMFLIDDNV